MNNRPIIYSDIEVLYKLASDYYERMSIQKNKRGSDFISSLLQQSDLCINIEDDKLEGLLKSCETENPDDLGMFLLAINGSHCATPDVFQSIIDNEEEIVSQNGTLFFLDKTVEETKRLRDEYGVWALNGDEITEDVFKFTFNNNYDPNENDKRPLSDNGWRNELNGILFPVCNSIVVSDDYLVSNSNSDKYIGLSNLTMLFDVILPKSTTLKVPFYITIFTDPNPHGNNPNDNVMKSKVRNWIDDEIKPLRRNYNIVVEVIFTKKALHDRRLLTLHYYIDPDKGFHVFLPQSNNVYKDGDDINKVHAESFYFNYGNPYVKGTSQYEIAYRDTCKLKKIYENAYDNFIQGHDVEGVDKVAGDIPTSKKSKNCVLN